MRLGIFLLAFVSCCSFAKANQNCLVGNLLVKENAIISKSLESKSCEGLCTKQTITSEQGSIVLLGCETNTIKNLMNFGKTCKSDLIEESCSCNEDECNKVDLPEILPSNTFVASNITCYVGFYANNTVANGNNFGTGDSVICGDGNVCVSVSGIYRGYSAGVYACMPQAYCDSVFPGTQSGTKCQAVNGTAVNECCCYDQDCRSLAPVQPAPPPQPWNKNNVTCYSGIYLNGNPLGGSWSQCLGECGSFRIRSRINSATVWGEVYVCDPVNVFTSVNLMNDCQTIDAANITNVETALITACACNTNKCLDPTVVPPVYPVKQLKCATGVLNNKTWIGAEMGCTGRCGRMKFIANGQLINYYTCLPYDVCAGFGQESSENIPYSPPQDEEIQISCCSASDNCNANSAIILGSLNNTAVSTVKYPILCYGGIHVNGKPITNSAYGLCQGECASATFMTQFAGKAHNATIYTCDPITVCQQANISNGCGNVLGVQACCCDNDLCLDPRRGAPRPLLRCYSGISIPTDNFNAGGDEFCDGWCGSLTSVVNNKNVTAYFCAAVPVCRYFGLGFGGQYGNCASLPGASPPVQGCCCSDSDNCLAPAGVNVTAVPARFEQPIVCLQGIHINGNPMTTPFYQTCLGECVSVTFAGSLAGGNHTVSLYTCDPSSTCQALKLNNNCAQIDGSVEACCCDTDTCIDPYIQKYPGKKLTCFTGIHMSLTNFTTGAEVDCDGNCASVSSVIYGNYMDVVTAYQCVPKKVCRSLGLSNSNNTIYFDRAVNVACCDIADNCNVKKKDFDPTFYPRAIAETPRACYSGVFLDGKVISDGGWVACQGDCVSLSANTTLNGNSVLASLYTCDPSIVCRNLQVLNRCHNIEDGFEACCCDTDACLDPTSTPPVKPHGYGNLCYNGVNSYDQTTNISILNTGQTAECQGTCASVSSNIGNIKFTAFSCVPNYVCSYLGLYNDCQSTFVDRTVKGCCCDNGPNCNFYQVPTVGNLTEPRGRPRREYPITCPSGLIVDGSNVTPLQFQVCDGECASVSINGTLNSTIHSATLYTCDPSSVCWTLGVHNSCASPESGVTACCCDTDACLDPRRNKTVPTPPLKCYVGVYSNLLKTGSEQLCDGKCASIEARVANDDVTVFACVPHVLCRSLEVYDECKRLAPFFPEYRACCCDNSDNCNVAMSRENGKINTSIPITPLNDFPISCYSGLFFNGYSYGASEWRTCQGDCVSISLNSTFNGTTVVGSLYTCDPSRVCYGLGLVNTCKTLENGVQGCCCNSNGCLDPTKNPAKTPGNPLMCYVGVYSNYSINGRPYSVGSQVQCNGKCSSLNGVINNYQISTYQCVPSSICRSLELYDDCKTVYMDKQVNACCCDNFNNCNVANATYIRVPDPKPSTDLSIACYSGLYVNGTAITPITLGGCQGECSSVSITGTLNGKLQTATLYGCDPSTVCKQLLNGNGCVNPLPGFTGCCCNTDICLDPTKNITVPAGSRQCYIGVYAQGKAIGSSSTCNGQCASISGTLANDSVTVFGCVPTAVCRSLEVYDGCRNLPNDASVSGCCCNNKDNCNIDLAGLTGKVNPINIPKNPRDYPIACYSGLFVNNVSIVSAGWQACQGECASASITTSINNTLTTATLYTCDPVSACWQLGVRDNCTTIESGLTGCCCSTDACLDPTATPPRTPINKLKCYVGLKSTYKGGLSLGAETYCDGQCASLSGIVGGENVTTYHCVPNYICKTLELNDQCRPFWQDREVSACCCNNQDNCNVKDPSIIPGPAVLPDFPTACYSGLIVNNKPYTPLTIGACYGDCASITISTTIQNKNHTATLLTCDPTTVCQKLNISNACHTVEPGVSGCCCDSDGCINPYTNQWPGPLSCYVGIYTSDGKINAGATVPCPHGYCGSLETNVNNVTYKSYHCVPKPICKSLGLNNEKKTISTDKAITGYCCTTGTNCHVTEAAVNTTNVVPPPTGNPNPIACRSSIYLNGSPVTADGFSSCFGQCASVTYNTTYNNAQNVLTIYGCDPTAVCDTLGLSNSCASLDGGVSGCCCTTDSCVGPNVIPTPQTTYASSTTFSILSIFTAVYMAFNAI